MAGKTRITRSPEGCRPPTLLLCRRSGQFATSTQLCLPSNAKPKKAMQLFYSQSILISNSYWCCVHLPDLFRCPSLKGNVGIAHPHSIDLSPLLGEKTIWARSNLITPRGLGQLPDGLIQFGHGKSRGGRIMKRNGGAERDRCIIERLSRNRIITSPFKCVINTGRDKTQRIIAVI